LDGIGRSDGKKPAITGLFVQHWTWLDYFVVEAGGIEPPSEDRPEMATTRLVRELELAARPPTDGLPLSQPI
jgi:hypothetical protein